jgi:ABC-type uncharacterized transport system permease subunit
LQESSILWLRVAALLYLPGLLVALISALRGRVNSMREGSFRGALIAFLMGTTIHLVAMVEEALEVGSFPANNFFEAISLLGLLLAVVTLLCQLVYRFESLAVLLMPLVFLMTLTGTGAAVNPSLELGSLRDAWLVTHVACIMLGYTGLVVTAAVSLFYLWRERQLKQKKLPSLKDSIPPLVTLDGIIGKALGWGFLFLTAGLVLGIIWASQESGMRWIREEKILIAIATWLVTLVLVYLRMASGWRGRKVAYLALTAVGSCAITWVTHAGVASVLRQ